MQPDETETGRPSENDTDHSDAEQIGRLLERVDVREGWAVEQDGSSLTLDYEAVSEYRDRLKRQSPPGIDVNYIGSMWMLASHDRIGEGLGIEHQGILNLGSGVDCHHLDDAVEAVEHGMEQVEQSVGEELDDTHTVRGWPYA